MGHYVKGIETAGQALAELDRYVEAIDDLEDGEWVDIERYSGAKGAGIKSLSKREAIRSILREKVDIVNKSFEPLKALAPKVIQVQDGAPVYDSVEELDELIKLKEKELKINGDDKDD